MDGTQICNVCHGSEFFEEDGQYWCVECNTMSQQIMLVDQSAYQAPEVDEMDQTENSISEVVTEFQQKLTSFELYTKILRGLALELVDLGVAPELYKVAKVLWLTYLKKCGVILNKFNMPVLPGCVNQKDIEVLYGVQNVSRRKLITGSANTIRKAKTARVRTANKVSAYAKKKKQRQLMQQLILEDEGLSGTESTTLPPPSPSVHSNLSSSRYSSDFETDDEKVQDIKVTKGTYKFLRKRRKTYLKRTDLKRPAFIPSSSLTSRIEKKKMHVAPLDVVSVLWIALQYTSSSYLQLGDFYRLVADGYLCLDNLERFVPEEYRNFASFRYFVRSFTRKSFLTRCGVICSIFDMKKIRTCDIRLVVRRYVADMSLPEDILEYTDKMLLLTHSPPHPLVPYSHRLLPEYDLIAMAIILVTLKVLFGVDDNTERELSNVASRLNRHRNSPQPAQFCFTSWLEHLEVRSTLISSLHNVTHENKYPRLVAHRLAAEAILEKGGLKTSRKVKRVFPGNSRRMKPFLLSGLNSLQNDLDGDPLGRPMKPPLAVKFEEPYLPQWTNQILSQPYLIMDPKVRDILDMDFKSSSLEFLNPDKFSSLCSRLDIASSVQKGRSSLSPAYYNISMGHYMRPPPQQTNIAQVEVKVREKERPIREEIDDLDEKLARIRQESERVESSECVEKNSIGNERTPRIKDETYGKLTLLVPYYQYWVTSDKLVLNLHGTRYKYLHKQSRCVQQAIASLCPGHFVFLLNYGASMVRSQPYHLYATVCLLEQTVLGELGAESKLWPREETKKKRGKQKRKKEEE